MTDKVRAFTRAALWMLPIWTGLLFLSTLTHQPDPQTAFADFAAYITTGQFLISHLIGSIVGAALGSIGIVGLVLFLQDTKAAGKALTGMAAIIAGNTLNTAVFGIAAFAQPAMGRMFQAGQESAVEFYNLTYGVPLFVTALTGMLLLIIGGIASGMAITSSGRLPKWAGWLFAIGMTGFVLGLFVPVAMSIFSPLMVISSAAVAWKAGRQAQAPSGVPVVS